MKIKIHSHADLKLIVWLIYVAALVELIFTSCVLNQEEVLKGVRSVGNMLVVGCTSSATICNNEGYFNYTDDYTRNNDYIKRNV